MIRLVKSSISAQLLSIVFIAVTLCLSVTALFIVQKVQAEYLNFFTTTHQEKSELLTSQMEGAFKWKKADGVKASIKGAEENPQSNLTNFHAVLADGTALYNFESTELTPYKSEGALDAAVLEALKQGTTVAVNAADHFLVYVPSLAAKDKEFLGYASYTWTLDQVTSDVKGITVSMLGIFLVVLLVLVAALGYGIRVLAVRPLNRLVAVMESLSADNTSMDIPYAGKTNEIGKISSTLSIFKQRVIERKNLEAEKGRIAEEAEIQRREDMKALADKFRSRIQGIIQAVAAAATELLHSAQGVNDVVEKTKELSTQAFQASNRANDNITDIVGSVSELSSSVLHVSQQVQISTDNVGTATSIVDEADVKAMELVTSAEKIGNVTGLISDIASQINLLALNATIESARAGDAGKGFAVVAQEVKNLAGQTDASITEIQSVIEAMQNVTNDMVDKMQQAKESVRHIRTSSEGISLAIQEQSAGTARISSNMDNVAEETGSVNASITQLDQQTEQARQVSDELAQAAQELSVQAEALEKEVSTFLSELA